MHRHSIAFSKAASTPVAAFFHFTDHIERFKSPISSVTYNEVNKKKRSSWSAFLFKLQ
jgi:hypothetical protein